MVYTLLYSTPIYSKCPPPAKVLETTPVVEFLRPIPVSKNAYFNEIHVQETSLPSTVCGILRPSAARAETPSRSSTAPSSGLSSVGKREKPKHLTRSVLDRFISNKVYYNKASDIQKVCSSKIPKKDWCPRVREAQELEIGKFENYNLFSQVKDEGQYPRLRTAWVVTRVSNRNSVARNCAQLRAMLASACAILLRGIAL